MLESILAVFFITFLFFVLFRLACLLETKILLGHAAARVARARTVGFNDFMCEKVGRVALIPVSGRRLWPLVGEDVDSSTGEEKLSDTMLDERIPLYLSSPDPSTAAGLLDYERWEGFEVKPGGDTKTKLTFDLLGWESTLEGEARIETHYPDYL